MVAVERLVGALEQGLDAVRFRQQRGHSAGETEFRRARRVDRHVGLREVAREFVGQFAGTCPRCIRQEHGITPAAEARGVVAFPEVLVEDARHGLENTVAGMVSVGIVDGLEVVEFQDKHREVGPQLAGAGHFVCGRLVERPVVVQAGESVGAGLPGKLSAEQDPVGDVAVRSHHAQRFAVGGPLDDAAAVEHPDPTAVAVTHARLALVDVALAAEAFLQLLVRSQQILRMDVIHPCLDADGLQLGQRAADDASPLLVERRFARLHVPLPRAGVGVRQNVGEVFALVQQQLLAPVLLLEIGVPPPRDDHRERGHDCMHGNVHERSGQLQSAEAQRGNHVEGQGHQREDAHLTGRSHGRRKEHGDPIIRQFQSGARQRRLNDENHRDDGDGRHPPVTAGKESRIFGIVHGEQEDRHHTRSAALVTERLRANPASDGGQNTPCRGEQAPLAAPAAAPDDSIMKTQIKNPAAGVHESRDDRSRTWSGHTVNSKVRSEGRVLAAQARAAKAKDNYLARQAKGGG